MKMQLNEVQKLQKIAGILKEEEKIFKLKIINKNGKSTIQKVSVDPNTTQLFTIISNLKKSKNIEDVEILEDSK